MQQKSQKWLKKDKS